MDDLNLTEQETQILHNCYVDTKYMCKALFPEIFSAPFSILHDQIFERIESPNPKKAIAAPRGLGKTSIARTIAKKGILYRDFHFIVYLSNSATLAEMQTENMKRTLLSNQNVRRLFGSIKVSDVGEVDDTFSKLAWVAFGSTLVLPRGMGQQIRGLNWFNYRPDLIIIDDLENKEDLRNEELRKKQKEWFFSDVMKTEDMYGKPPVVIYIDTIKHEDALLQLLIDSPEWDSVRLSICDQNYNTYDANYMTTEEIKLEVEQHREKGLMDLFYMERMNLPISIEDAVFKDEYFKYFEDEKDRLVVYKTNESGSLVKEEIFNNRLIHVTIVDPAKTVQLHSAESAVVTIAVDRESHKIFIREIESRRVRPDALYDMMFGQVMRQKSFILAVEVTSLHQFISQPIESEMRVRNLHPIYIEMNAVGKKEERIATLAPLYKLGYMYHNKSNCAPLEAQLRSFPRSKLFDIMDAVAYINKVMDEKAMYFDPPDTDNEDTEAEFSELEYEKPIDEWRLL
jgi:hypothetical protein